MSASSLPVARAPGNGLGTLIDRYIAREVAVRTLAVLAILLPTLLLERGLRLVNQLAAAGGHLPHVFPMVANLAPYYFGSALPAAFLVGILLTVARLDEELQIEAMFSAGLSLVRVVGVLIGLGAVVSAICLVVGGFAEPLGHYGFRAARDAAINAGWTARLQSGGFRGHGQAVTLSADIADRGGHRLRGVFVHQRSASGQEIVVTAREADLRLEPDGTATRLRLRDGRVLADRPGYAPAAGGFAAYDLVVPDPERAVTAPRGEDAREMTSPELLRRLAGGPGSTSRHAAAAEFYGRIAKALTIPLLPLIALPLGMAASRGRRMGGFTVAAVLILGFYQTLRLVQALAGQGRLDPLPAIGGLYVAFLAVAAWIFLSSRRLQGVWGLAALVIFIQGLADRRPRFSLRLPSLPVGRRLPGYVAFAFAASTLGAAAAISGLVGAIDLFERTDDILDRGLGLAGVAHYGLMRAPVIAQQFAPLSLVAGGIFAFLGLSRRSEIVAARASGRSLAQVYGMAAPTAFIAALAIAFLAEVASPAAQAELARWWEATAPAAERPPTLRWFRVGDAIVRAERIAPDGSSAAGLSIFERGTDSQLRRRIAARDGRPALGALQLRVATITAMGAARPEVAAAAGLAWPTTLTRSDLAAQSARPLQISARTAWRHLTGAAPSSEGTARAETRLHRTVAEPLIPFIMLLAACPLAMTSPRTGPGPWRIAFAAGFGMVYLTADGFMTAMGQTGLAPPWIGAWAAPLVLGGVALVVAIFAED